MMQARRLDAERGRPIRFTFAGRTIDSFEGETVAAALLAAGEGAFGRTRDGDPRQPLCNMGTCFDCAVTIDGAALTRSCLTPAAEGMVVEPAEGVAP